MNSTYKNCIGTNTKTQWKRNDTVSKVIDFEQSEQTQSQRQWARENSVPRTTLQYWISRKKAIDASPTFITFFESPDGAAFLHRMMTALHFIFTKLGVASIRNVSKFLELCGVSRFVASSYSTQCRISNKMDEKIIEFGQQEKEDLAPKMPAKKISLCEDETFHPQICLVAIEPVSNYIMLEEYADNRESATWDNAINQSICGLPVEVIQVTSDEARALISHTTKGLKAHHSSDCFHVSREIGKGTSGALASKVKQAEKEFDLAVKKTQKEVLAQKNYTTPPKRPVGRPKNFDKRIASASELESQAKTKLKQAKQDQEAVRDAKAKIGKVYHPFDPETGTTQNAQKVLELLESCFETVGEATQNLSDRCKKYIDKAHRVVGNMVDTVTFFFTTITQYMDDMEISKQERQLMNDYLIPAFYLQRVVRGEKDFERRMIISKKSQELFAVADNLSARYSKSSVDRLKNASKECAQIFQRSSSCVEGRNAQLSLRHHGIHKLSDKCLKARTVVHNYYIKGWDGITPAEKFFEAKHRDLFEWLLDNMDYPARPRKHLEKAA
jgi:hypothetical protein